LKKITKLIMSALLGMTLFSTTLSADVTKGKEIYVKKLKAKCGISGSAFAGKHTQDRWEEIYDAGALSGEIKKICHGHTVGTKLLPHIYDFVYKYASDSGNVPNI
jgi:hypothetical protein